MSRDVALKGQRKHIAQVGELPQPFPFRRDSRSRVKHCGGDRTALEPQDFVADARSHRNLGHIFGRKPRAFDEQCGKAVFAVTNERNRDLFPFEVGGLGDAGVDDQIPGGFFGLIQDRFQRRAPDRRAKPAAAGAAIIDVAAHQGRNPGGTADDNGFVLKPFVPEKLAILGAKHREIIQIQSRNSGADFFRARG